MIALGLAIVPLRRKFFLLSTYFTKHIREMRASPISNLQLWWLQENNQDSGWSVVFLLRKSTPSCLSLNAFLSFLLAPPPLRKKKKKGQTCICPGMFSKQGLQVENSYICLLNYGCLGHLKIHVG